MHGVFEYKFITLPNNESVASCFGERGGSNANGVENTSSLPARKCL